MSDPLKIKARLIYIHVASIKCPGCIESGKNFREPLWPILPYHERFLSSMKRFLKKIGALDAFLIRPKCVLRDSLKDCPSGLSNVSQAVVRRNIAVMVCIYDLLSAIFEGCILQGWFTLQACRSFFMSILEIP